MQTLSAEDVRRIVNGGERFLLVDFRNARTANISVDHEFVANLLKQTLRTSLPIIIRGTEAEVRLVEHAALALREAGCLEVWTYFESWPSVDEVRHVSKVRHNVVSYPDAIDRYGHERLAALC